MMTSPRALFFDACDVLYFRPRAQRHARLRAFLERLGLPSSNDSIRAAAAPVAEPARTGAISCNAYYDAILAACGVADAALLAEGRAAMAADHADVTLHDGVIPTLHALRERGFALGVITDSVSPATEKLRWLHGRGLDIPWDAFADSCDLGVCKPDPRIYRAALDACAAAASASAFVGHKTSELVGARAVGMTTVAVYSDPDAVADYYIGQFAELLTLPFSGGSK